MSDYFDLLEAELRAAVPRARATGGAAPIRRRVPDRTPAAVTRRIRLRPGAIPAAIGIVATVLVVGVALVMLGHGRATPSAAGPPPRTPATAPPSTVPPSNRAAPRHARDMLSGRGIDGVKFGAPRAAAVAALDRLLGVRGGAYRHDGLCAVDHTILWRSPKLQASLITYFSRERLVGYQYAESGNPLAPRRSLLATTRGLGLGDTLERARQLYGSAFTTSTAQGGSWRVNTKVGRIDGYASGVPRPGNLDAIKVLTIDAGNVGCPALSP